MNTLKPLAALVAASLIPVSVIADDATDNIEHIEVQGKLNRYSATKTNTPLIETARSISIESLQQLIDKGVQSLDDAFVYSAGVTGQTFGFATRGDWIKVRGLTVALYQDSLQTLFGHYNNTRPHVHSLEQVEILKGPVSVLYGQGQAGGMVNLVTKRPTGEEKGEISAEFGTFSHRQIKADFTGSLNEEQTLLYRFVGAYKKADTQVDFVEDNSQLILPSLTWQASEDTSLTFIASRQEYDGDTAAQFLPLNGTLHPAKNGLHLDNGVYAGEPDFNHYISESDSYTLLVDHQFNDDWWLEATFKKTSGEVDYQQTWPMFDGTLDRVSPIPQEPLLSPRTFYVNDSSSDQSASDLRLHGEIVIGEVEHQILAGVQYQNVETSSSRIYISGPDFFASYPQFWINLFDPQYGEFPDDAFLSQLTPRVTQDDVKDRGFYLHDQISYGNWRANIGVRRDNTEQDNGNHVQKDNATSLSAGILYDTDFGLSPYLSYAESFDPKIGTDSITGNQFKPVEGKQIEAGIKYVPDSVPGLFTLSLFDIEVTNLDNPSSLPSAPSQQEGTTEIKGIELEGIVELGDFSLEVNLSSLDTEDPNGFKLDSVSEEQASFWLGYKGRDAFEGFKAGIGGRYNSESYSQNALRKIETPSYTIVDFMLGYQWQQWQLALNINNLANKKYYTSCLSRGDCFPAKERSIVGSISYKF